MQAPYFPMVMLYALMAALAAADAALTSYGLIPVVNGLPWLRVHFITLGIMAQLVFAVLPALVAAGVGATPPRARWDIWAALNVGLPVLFVGIPLVSQPLIFTGGALMMVALLLLLQHLAGIKSPGVRGSVTSDQPPAPSQGRRFYLAGLAYLALGVFIGTGLWLGWTAPLGMAAPTEVHIHANAWGFMSLVFAGLLLDLHPRLGRRPLAWPRSVTPMFWLMTLGALGLVLGPWLDARLLTAPGMILYILGAILLLVNVLRPLLAALAPWPAGAWHLALCYLWILAPLAAAPFILLGAPGFPGPVVEQNAPQALIYGWALQFGYAVAPFFIHHALRPTVPASLGGNRWSVLTVNMGCVLLWAGMFVPDAHSALHGTAYVLWALSLLPIAWQLWSIVTPPLSDTRHSPAAQ